ncbi:uncharacterized protein LAESUDRAFT_720873 [Laetiporus sulphureus 93-53]|uniref:Uncharacterized protein n=1 Tax=Laetiporus sulphureus 93-53 TaxID=1314785 RepID=A0A165HEA1_9APHY|nr:uncharacterized protein LAESUDRAFT_720873 [Laetiporus sulphureus 93-53]KZT11622.1 hypothetical protein LAESUDRAFT_720873 [Laetiporus sulphureus 93-53]
MDRTKQYRRGGLSDWKRTNVRKSNCRRLQLLWNSLRRIGLLHFTDTHRRSGKCTGKRFERFKQPITATVSRWMAPFFLVSSLVKRIVGCEVEV